MSKIHITHKDKQQLQTLNWLADGTERSIEIYTVFTDDPCFLRKLFVRLYFCQVKLHHFFSLSAERHRQTDRRVDWHMQTHAATNEKSANMAGAHDSNIETIQRNIVSFGSNLHRVSKKLCKKLFLSELSQISTNFDDSEQKDGKEARIMRDALIFHLI